VAHLGVAELADVAHAAYGRELRDVARLHGGSKKGVYRLTLDDGTTGVAYVWRASEDYWPEHEYDPLFGNASGRDLFLAAHTALSEAGMCVPRLVLVDHDVIVVEDLGGSFLEKQLDDSQPLERLWDASRPCTSASVRATAVPAHCGPPTRHPYRTSSWNEPSGTWKPAAQGFPASRQHARTWKPFCANGTR
jgi:hypothetical protein